MSTLPNQDKLKARKTDLRQLAIQNRKLQRDRVQISRSLCQKVLVLPEYLLADTVCAYVGVDSEVLTQDFIKNAMLHDKRIAIPYVHKDHLCLFHLHDLDDLAPAPFGLLEPRSELRGQPKMGIDPADVGLYLVPGLAFGVNGERLGHGKGYYDDLLWRASVKAYKVGLCYACQIMEDIPMTVHDVYMDLVIAEGDRRHKISLDLTHTGDEPRKGNG
jgi:5-formyltetrahydrofolate cyclo-ligase